jgi:hypothetical protein
MIALDHSRKKFLDKEIMRDGVDVEGKANILFRGIQDTFAAGDTGIVNQNGWVSNKASDFAGNRCNGRGRRDIAFEIVDVGR